VILKRIRVQNYKAIDDTGWVPVDERVTALVGKNEAGKTGILRSLWKSKNVASRKFDKLLDYPRGRYSKERNGTQEVTALEFELTNSEAEVLAGQFPQDFKLQPTKAVFTTCYKGEEETESFVTFDEGVEAEWARSASKARESVSQLMTALQGAGPSEEVTKAADGASQTMRDGVHPWDSTALQSMAAFQAAVVQWVNADSGTRNAVAVAERKRLDEFLTWARQGDPFAKARKWVAENMPAFIYFDNYGQLETRVHLPAYIQRQKGQDEKTRTQAALFQQSNLDPQEILTLGRQRESGESDDAVQRRKDKRRALLDSASFGLTGDWIDWWAEKRHRLHFDADGDDLVLKVSDDHNEFPIPFEERSHGFQWFFSFYLVFIVESARAHKGAILLLDEPGLHLHPTLQNKLVKLFDRISEKNQLLYSTHLPFLVDGEHLERVRTVHLAGPDPQKTVVSNDVRPTGDKDTLFPLQAALGYSIAQTLFLGKRSVIVEGITDYWLIKALDSALAATGNGTRLHPDTVIIPTGGTSRLMPLASIMLSTTGVDGRKLLVLLDSDAEGVKAAQRATQDLFVDDKSRILMLADAVGLQQATVEDLVPREVYFKTMADCGYAVTCLAEDKKAATNVEAMSRAFDRSGIGKVTTEHKAKAALHLVDAWGKKPADIPTETRTKAEQLFAQINKRFEV
jgi:predicted ATP-dependent endonuclease of OLD family